MRVPDFADKPSAKTMRMCDDCDEPADGPGDAERVNCDCGSVVCSSCCEAFAGESYCRDCAIVYERGRADAAVTELDEERERLALALRGHLADSICDDIASGVFGRTGGHS